MENVKTAITVGQPDIRRTFITITEQSTGETRKLSFADVESRVSDILIPIAAPEEVRDLLVTAKNLLVYSWFYYPFSVTASLQSYAAVERALKIRLNRPKGMLHELLDSAIRQKLITDAGFVRWKGRAQAFRDIHGIEESQSARPLVEVLLDMLPHFRNTIAHGGRLLDDMGFNQVDLACEIISQLYAEDKPA